MCFLLGRWYSMKNRCYNPNDKQYKNYGGRGIFICDKWRYSYKEFAKWVFRHSNYKKGLTIDRINNDGCYCPNNCRFATLTEQGNNQRTNLPKITYKGITQSIQQWSYSVKIPYYCISHRIHKLKWSVERAITTPF